MRRLALAPILVCALLSPSTALALGVGDIELQSALNQPLDAEIPLRGVSPEERGNIVVALASEEAFREVGLERPFSLTRLQFEVASRNGSNYIQVSSNEPITEPFLSFLIEVDSPQGNLLREYTVLLDPPVFASDEGGSTTDEGRDRQPARDDADEPSGATGAMTGGGDMSGRLADTDTAGDTASSTDSEAPSASAEQQRQGQFGDTPMFLRIAREEEAAERQLAEQAAQRKREREAAAAARERAQAESEPTSSERTMSGAMTPGADSGQPGSAEQSRQQDYGPVQEGETLWDIAARLQRDEVTIQQMMLALLRYNPEAFESDNINRLKQGYVLRVPDADEVRSVSAQQAIAQVREQNGLWREWRDSLQQGDATRVAATQEPQDTDGTADSAPGDAGESGAASAGADDSRLDIVGADEGGATSDESTSATASNASGAREQLQLAREELASVRSEKEDLSERVEQLESTVDKMEQLVTVREEQLAQLERQLAELREQNGESGDTATTTTGAGDGAQGEQADAATDAGEAAQGEEDDMMVADAAGGSGGGGGTTASGDSGGDAAGDSAEGEGTTGDQASAGEQSAAEDGGAGTQTAASDQQREVVNPTDDTQQQERGWLDTALGFLASIGATVSGAVSGLTGGGALSLPVIGGAGVAVLAFVLLAVRRRRAAQAAADDELMAPIAVGEHHADTEPMGLGGDDRPATESPVATADGPSENSVKASLMDEELDLSGLDVDPEGATPGDEAEQDDTLVEADTYLAYGLHQQAEDLLRLALEEQPDRLDYREKLLETLSAAGKSDEFVSAAEDFHNRLGGSSDPAWQRVSAMGRKVAPDHALFAAGAAAGGGATAASDTGAGDDDFAFDLGSDEPSASSGDDLPGGAEADLDLGETTPAATASEGSGGSDDLTFDLSDLEDSTPAAEPVTETSESPTTSAAGADNGLDFDLGDFGLGDDSPAATSGGDEGGTEVASASAPADDGLDLDLGDLGIDDSTSTAGSDSGGASAQDEGEIDLSDFDVDLGDDSSGPATDTAAAGTGEGDLSLDLDESTSSGSSALDDFGLVGLDSDTAGATGGIEDLETSASESTTASADKEDPFGGLDDLGGGDSDSGEFDLSSLEQELGESDASQPAPTAAAGGTASEGEGDDLATMLDLAKAYIDMGDAESASNALEEVIAGGTEEQRSEAQSLLETVQ